MIEVSIHTLVKPTERVDKVTLALDKIFPDLTMDIRVDRIEGYGGLDSLREFHRLLREQRILDTARSVMLAGMVKDAVQFKMGKQAAYMGKVNFPPEEEPLGSIHVQISGHEELIDWLAPKTVDGKPIMEIEMLEDR